MSNIKAPPHFVPFCGQASTVLSATVQKIFCKHYSKPKQKQNKMKTKTEKNQMNHPRVASRAEWLAARLKLLKAEKIGTKQGAFFAADSAAPTNKDR